MASTSSLTQRFLLALLIALSISSLPAQTFSVVRYFTNFANGVHPESDLVVDGDVLYGTASSVVFRVQMDGEGYTVLKQFTNGTDGSHLAAGLVLSGSTLYGAAAGGGTNSNGTIFKIETNGTGFAVLKTFTDTPDGRMPYQGLSLIDGKLFGTTYEGGANGDGTVFKLNTDGNDYSVVKSFTNNLDGAVPHGRLVSDGNTLYGVTGIGGTNSGRGTIFKLNHDGGGFVVIKTFFGSIEGSYPPSGLVLNGSTLYGIASGGSNNGGVVFRVGTDGTDYRVIKNFGFVPDGADPSGLTMSGGTLYGTMATGSVTGSPAGNGMIYRINVDGSDHAVLKSFSEFANENYRVNSDGAFPWAGVMVSGKALYGTTYSGGFDYNLSWSEYYDGGGTVFSLTLTNSLTILTGDGCFGARSNNFGFTVVGAFDQVVVVEACTNLSTFDWLPLRTNALGGGGFYFTDPDWTNYPGRFYRARSL